MLRRCVKWMPHPDSFAFHHRPLNAPGKVAATPLVFSAGGGHIGAFEDVVGTVAAQRRLPEELAWVPLAPVPTQNVPPATLVAFTPFSRFTVWLWLESTLLT